MVSSPTLSAYKVAETFNLLASLAPAGSISSQGPAAFPHAHRQRSIQPEARIRDQLSDINTYLAASNYDGAQAAFPPTAPERFLR